MTIPVVTSSDLQDLPSLFPDLNLNDPQRQSVLLESQSRDVQAVPGSGKTTLLAVKLSLLANKWHLSHRGICVLSHTNVARDEIAGRVRRTGVGTSLLGYPHFIGTIHSFVNQFLALPFLRSKGIDVEIVDNDVFAARATALLGKTSALKYWVSKNPHRGEAVVQTLRYQGAELTLVAGEGKLPSSDTQAYKEAKLLKRTLSESGVFRHEDMFAFAERLLKSSSSLPSRLGSRFPLLFIDEMQDTSVEQEMLLSRAFDGTVVTQRFGDCNQRILSSAKGPAMLTFPRDECLSVDESRRFPESIASVVRRVQERGAPVVGHERSDALQPLLLLYDSASVTSVIRVFGEYAVSSLTDAVLQTGPVKAICFRKQGDANVDVGRHLADYWPAYAFTTLASSDRDSVCRLLGAPPEMGVSSCELGVRVRDVTRAVFLLLKRAGNEAASKAASPSALFRSLEEAGHDVKALRMLYRDLALSRHDSRDANANALAIEMMYTRLQHLLPPGVSQDTFAELAMRGEPPDASAEAVSRTHCTVQAGDRTVRVQFGTIASVKGETHVATLVLEAYGGPSKCFDLELALPFLAGEQSNITKLSETRKLLFRNLYVAMSRPQHLLCIAMNQQRAKRSLVGKLRDAGWQVATVASEGAA